MTLMCNEATLLENVFMLNVIEIALFWSACFWGNLNTKNTHKIVILILNPFFHLPLLVGCVVEFTQEWRQMLSLQCKLKVKQMKFSQICMFRLFILPSSIINLSCPLKTFLPFVQTEHFSVEIDIVNHSSVWWLFQSRLAVPRHFNHSYLSQLFFFYGELDKDKVPQYITTYYTIVVLLLFSRPVWGLFMAACWCPDHLCWVAIFPVLAFTQPSYDCVLQQRLPSVKTPINVYPFYLFDIWTSAGGKYSHLP